MNYQNQLNFTVQSVAGLKVRQHLRRRKTLELPGGSSLWRAASKICCLVLLVALGINLWVGSAVKQMNLTIQKIEAQQYEIRDDQISLLAERAQLMSESYVRRHAGEELALVVPSSKQVYKVK